MPSVVEALGHDCDSSWPSPLPSCDSGSDCAWQLAPRAMIAVARTAAFARPVWSSKLMPHPPSNDWTAECQVKITAYSF
jgi:hypothetical protein